jgi:hypothetical protein
VLGALASHIRSNLVAYLALFVVVLGALVVPMGALADDPPVPGTQHAVPPPPQADWTLLVSGDLRGPWADNRIFYARTRADTKKWLRYLIPRPSYRRRFQHLNFSKYGLLAIFHKPLFEAEASVRYVSLLPVALGVTLEIHQRGQGGHVPVVRVPFILIRVKKDSVPNRLRALYIYETAT